MQRASRSATSASRAWNTSALTFCGAQPERRADLGVAEVAELRHHERFPLLLGQAPEVGHQLAQLSAPPDLLGEVVEPALGQLGRHCRVPARGEHRAAAVARDREQPRAHHVRRAAGAQRAVRAQERLLQRLLAVLAVAEHVAAEREQRGVVAVVEGFERGRVAAPHEGREARIVLPAEPSVGA